MRRSYDSNVIFTLMNSFSTSDDTKAFLSKAHADLLKEPFIELVQNKSPKVDANTFKPAEYPQSPDMEWSVFCRVLGCSSIVSQLLNVLNLF